jgi:hypothetical protein
MLSLKLFASIKESRRRSAPQSTEEGALITRRLQELLAVPTPTLEVETLFTKASSESRLDMRERVQPVGVMSPLPSAILSLVKSGYVSLT